MTDGSQGEPDGDPNDVETYDDEDSLLAENLGEASPIDDEERRHAMELRESKLNAVLRAWKEQTDSEREMRTAYAKLLLRGLFAQIVLVNLAFFLIGLQLLDVDEWTARIFIMAVFSEIAGMVFFIVKYLFSRTDQDVLKLIEKL